MSTALYPKDNPCLRISAANEGTKHHQAANLDEDIVGYARLTGRENVRFRQFIGTKGVLYELIFAMK